MEKLKSPKGFIVVLPGEIIEIPQDSDKSWLTLFYSLPRELAEKWKPAYDLPRCPYEVLRTDKYDHIVCDDMFKLLVWDCYAWSAWQFFQVKDRKGNYTVFQTACRFSVGGLFISPHQIKEVIHYGKTKNHPRTESRDC